MAAKKTRSALFSRPVPADDVVVRSVKLGDGIAAKLGPFFEGHGLTILQYNVLRILYVRDPDGEGLPSGTIRDGLMVRGPDVSRLIDRLQKAGWLERVRSTDDRRVVKVRLTRAGTELVERVHQPLLQNNRALLAHMSKAELQQLARLLSRALQAFD